MLLSVGRSVAQSGAASGQRVRKAQPLGTATGFGGSPLSTTRRRSRAETGDVNVEPRTEGMLAGRMDSQHFEQVLVNLMLNAEQAMAGRPEPAITIAYGREGDAVVLSVSDTGPGIDLARHEEYFRPFMTTRTGAVGLGLTASRALVRACGGELRFVEPSVVEVRIPAK